MTDRRPLVAKSAMTRRSDLSDCVVDGPLIAQCPRLPRAETTPSASSPALNRDRSHRCLLDPGGSRRVGRGARGLAMFDGRTVILEGPFSAVSKPIFAIRLCY